MDKGPEGLEWFWWMIGYALFAAFGGALGFIMRKLDAKEKIAPWRVFFEALCAAFAGVLVAQFCDAMGIPVKWTAPMVGVFGWIGGSAAMRYLEKLSSRKLGAE